MLTLIFFGSAVAAPAIVQAGPATLIDIPRYAEFGINQAKSSASTAFQSSVATALINIISFATNRLAYDAATAIVNGGNAGDALYDGTPVQVLFKEVGAAVAGEAIYQLDDVITAPGGVLGNFNLCAPSNPRTLLNFKLGIRDAFRRPEPNCDINAVTANWRGYLASLQQDTSAPFKSQMILAKLSEMYQPGTNEFSAGIQLYSDILTEAQNEALTAKEIRLQNGPFKDVVDFVTGQVTTPAQWLEHDLMYKNDQKLDEPREATLAMLANPNLLLTIGLQMGSVFTNTLLSSAQQKLYNGFFKFDDVRVDPFNPDSFTTGQASSSVLDQFRSLLTVKPLQISNYSLLSEFSTCPQNNRALYNCVADTSFVNAVARAESGAPLTISEAIDEGLIDKNWALIPESDTGRNQDDNCYTYGFCYSNLVKMRKARIISVGWELAAKSEANVNGDTTLGEVLAGFNDCGPGDAPDQEHPWCKLVDPNWVLKYPETQCRASVHGQLLQTEQADERQDECVDAPSCIATDENGNCIGGYGYCTAEENTWKFRGESCPAEYASCTVYQGESGSVAYLKNTIDAGSCTSDNAGCLWYARNKVSQTDGTFAYENITDLASADSAGGTYNERMYFNGNVESCDQSSGGCSEVIARTDDLRLNIVVNPSFESDSNTDSVPDAWRVEGRNFAYSTDGSSARSGTSAATGNENTAIVQEGLSLGQARFYTLSYYGFGEDLHAYLTLTTDAGDEVDLSGTTISSACAIIDRDRDGTKETVQLDLMGEYDTYQRATCTFTVPALANAADMVFGKLSLTGDADTSFDDIALEQGEDASDYHDGYGTTDLDTLTVKIPPAYLGCTGSSATDPEECQDYAQICNEVDVGCSLYTPVNGDPEITGIVGDLDVCPAECAGYDTYKQEPSLYEPAGAFPLYFIPDTATSCSAENVGCDEFTNQTDESLAYFTYIRACVTTSQAAANVSSDNAATFYTWEGSDNTGYQLKTWQLLESNLSTTTQTHTESGEVDTNPSEAPCTSWNAIQDGIVCADNAAEIFDNPDCDEHGDIFTNSDCREFYDANGAVHFRSFSQTVTVNDACVAYRKTDLVGDSSGERESNCTVSGGFYDDATGNCRYFGYAQESTLCPAQEKGCREYTGGRSRNSRLVFSELFEEGTLNNWDNESASFATLSNESLAGGGHSVEITDTLSTFVFNNGSSCADAEGCEGSAVSLGGTCTVAQGNQYCGVLNNELFAGKTYAVSFLVKGSGTVNVGFDIAADNENPEIDVAVGAAAATDGWQEITLGPIAVNGEDYPGFGQGTALVLSVSGRADVYIDNVVIREGEDNLALIKDSWSTPAVCDQTPAGSDSPQYYLGCQEYVDQNGESSYQKSFSRLCSEQKVGCDSFFQTHESDSVSASVENATCNNLGGAVSSATACYLGINGDGSFDTASQYLCTIGAGESSCAFTIGWYIPAGTLPAHVTYGPSTVIVPSDNDVFLVVNDDVTCDSGASGCTELGKPTFSADKNSTTSMTSVFLINDPDAYDSTLCRHEDLFCAAFTKRDGSEDYFKDPVNQTCEYRDDVVISGESYSGWFRVGTDEFCYGTCNDGAAASCSSDADCADGVVCDTADPSYLIGGTASGIWRNGDNQFGGWAGVCESAYDSCSEFQDRIDVTDGGLYAQDDGESYYYLNNELLDNGAVPESQRCDGQVSLKNGCALFNNTSLSAQTYNASATDIASRHADVLFGGVQNDLVDPIDCNAANTAIVAQNGDSVDLCASRCVYDSGQYSDITDGATYEEKLTAERTSSVDYDSEDLYVFGTSCYVASDCAPLRAESGEQVHAIACASAVRVDPYSSTVTFDPSDDSFSQWQSGAANIGDGFVAAERLHNDTNEVVKVNRDRQCAQWLACSDEQTVWDEESGSYKNVCSSVNICSGYSSSSGSSFCTDWDFDAPAELFTADVYTARDVSWHGSEYSGYSIPDLYPTQELSQALISPAGKFCDFSNLESYGVTAMSFDGQSCNQDSDCFPEDSEITDAAAGVCKMRDAEYSLVLNAGSCADGTVDGTSCTVGYCEETGAACATNSECGSSGGNCIVGACYDIGTRACQESTDCGEGQVCSGGSCATIGDDVDVDTYIAGDYCSSAPRADGTRTIFVPSAQTKTGSCVQDSCLLTAAGEPYAEENAISKMCRAYPEANSPFSNELVTGWKTWVSTENIDTLGDTTQPLSIVTESAKTAGQVVAEAFLNGSPSFTAVDSDHFSRYGYTPYNLLAGFTNVKTCAAGEDCVCSYQKVSYADSGNIKYFAKNSNNFDDSQGICSGGPNDGAACVTDENCPLTSSGDTTLYGSCLKPSRIDTYTGMYGYCLEYDTAINVNGDRNQNACITWLPVDRLQGDSDLYAKNTEAGYTGGETAYCSYLTLYADIYTSSGTEGDVACIERDRSDVSTDQESCLETGVSCPPGMYLVAGTYYGSLSSDERRTASYADICRQGTPDDNCPFICVPTEGVMDDGSATSCNPDENMSLRRNLTHDNSVTRLDSSIADYSFNAYFIEDVETFQETVQSLRSCVSRGVQYIDRNTEGTFSDRNASFRMEETDNDNACGGGNDCGWTEYQNNFSVYLGCRDTVEVDNGEYTDAAAWTDRILGPNSTYAFDVDSAYDQFAYTKSTALTPFGRAMSSREINAQTDPQPAIVAQCVETSADNGSTFYNVQDGDECALGDQLGGSTPQARSFLSFEGVQFYDDGATIAFPLGDTTFTQVDAGNVGVVPTDSSYLAILLQNVFARSMGVQTFSDGIFDQESSTFSDSDEVGKGSVVRENDLDTDDPSYWDIRAQSGNAPVVYSLDTAHCEGTECEEGRASAITVNATDSGIQSGFGFFDATVKFYAAADKNQLPLRRIIVDWQDLQDSTADQTGSAASDNFYKNARGLVSGSTTSKCETDQEWGMTSESCDPNYLQYSHIYTCSGSVLADESRACTYDTNGNLTNSPCWLDSNSDTTPDTCAFQPRVHIRDNWGFCAGTCNLSFSSVVDSGSACFDYDGIAESDPELDECSYENYLTPGVSVDPWVYYDGIITVTP